jgi:hypothetical protein
MVYITLEYPLDLPDLKSTVCYARSGDSSITCWHELCCHILRLGEYKPLEGRGPN